MPSIAAMSYRHNVGFPYIYPDKRTQLSRKFHEYAVEDGRAEVSRQSGDRAALSTSSLSCTPTTSRTAAPTPCAPQFAERPLSRHRRRRRRSSGPLHGGANEEVCTMLDESVQGQRPAYIKKIRRQRQTHGFATASTRIRSRAKIIKWAATRSSRSPGAIPNSKSPSNSNASHSEDELLRPAQTLSQCRFLTPHHVPGNGFKPEMFTVLFAIPRTIGWLAQCRKC